MKEFWKFWEVKVWKEKKKKMENENVRTRGEKFQFSPNEVGQVVLHKRTLSVFNLLKKF